MFRFLVLVAALVTLPALAGAEDVWRWRDSGGQLHYSNVPGRAPAYAERVTTQLGRASGTVVSPKVESPNVEQLRQERERSSAESPRARHAVGACDMGAYGYFCPRFPSAPWLVVMNNPHELSDQVKQAHLLDALHIPWRSACR
jgi:uncharacterized protein DUF4124